MGRRKKLVEINEEKFSSMSRQEKLELFSEFNQLFHYELSRIPYSEIQVAQKGKAEIIAEEYFKGRGYEVYRSKVNGGYRCIGVEFYWQDFSLKITEEDKKLIKRLRSLMSPEEFKELAYIVKDKRGTPDLLLIKGEKISFVEVKFNYETVKSSIAVTSRL